MTEDVKKAEMKVDESTERFENALDGMINRTETYISDARQSVDKLITSAKSISDRVLGEFERSADQSVRLMKDKPLAPWIAVFMSGYLLGTFLTKKGPRVQRDLSRETTPPIQRLRPAP